MVRGTVEETLNKLLDEEADGSQTPIGTNEMKIVRIPEQGIIRESC